MLKSNHKKEKDSDNEDQLKKELHDLKKKLKKNPNDINLLYNLVEIMRRISAQERNTRLSIEALKLIDKIIELKPHDSLAWLERGITLYSLDRQDEAISDYTQSLHLETSSHAFYNRGVSKWQKIQIEYGTTIPKNKKTDELIKSIISDYKRALEIDSKYVDAQYNIAIINMNIGKFEQAISEFSKCIEMKPDDYMIYFNRATCYEHIEIPRYSNKLSIKRAIEDYKRVIELNHEYIFAYYNRALCYEMISNKGRYMDKRALILAISDYKKILKLDTQNQLALYNLAWALEQKGDINEAIKYFRKFNKICSNEIAISQISQHIKELCNKKLRTNKYQK